MENKLFSYPKIRTFKKYYVNLKYSKWKKIGNNYFNNILKRLVMKKIMIIGSAGAGKSTFSKKLSEKLHIDVIHLDALYWKPGWVQTPRDEWKTIIGEQCQKDRWIMDGNYSNTIIQRMAYADMVVFFDYPRIICLVRAIKRWLMNLGRTRLDMGKGCPEKIDLEFIRWIWTFPKIEKPKIIKLLNNYNGMIYILKNDKDVQGILKNMSNANDDDIKCGYLIVKKFDILYKKYAAEYDLKKTIYGIPRIDVSYENCNCKYFGLDREYYYNDDITDEDETDFIYDYYNALETLNNLNDDNYELIWTRLADSGVGSLPEFISIGYEPTYFYGDHFSIICDSLFIPRWHGTDDEGTAFQEYFNSLNKFGLFNFLEEAERFKEYYSTFEWAETGTFYVAEVFMRKEV
jgi:adenylate kinase family enzyme